MRYFHKRQEVSKLALLTLKFNNTGFYTHSLQTCQDTGASRDWLCSMVVQRTQQVSSDVPIVFLLGWGEEEGVGGREFHIIRI